MIYRAMTQSPTNFMTLVVRSQCPLSTRRSACDPMRLVPAITREVRALDPNQPLAAVKRASDHSRDARSSRPACLGTIGTCRCLCRSVPTEAPLMKTSAVFGTCGYDPR
jgi:hypothetical protein